MPLFSSDRRLDGDGETVRWRFVAVFVVVVCLATGFLVWLGYVATREWQRGAELLLHRRQAQAMTLVSAALSRDMEGTWTRIIVPINQSMLEEDPPYDLLEQTARAFARFPYPESFIFWRADGRENGVTYVFNRAERQPPWDNSHETDDPFPVVMLRDPLPLRDVVAAARQQAKASSRFIVLELDIAGVSYQVVAHLLFTSTKPHVLSGFAAFTVNVPWVRQEYFGPLLQQVSRIGGNEDTLSFAVTDDRGTLVTTTGPARTQPDDPQRHFPFLFLDPMVIASLSSPRSVVHEWTVRVQVSQDDTLLGAQRGARVTFSLMAVAAAISVIALLMALKAVRASTRLASAKSDFVSAVTHELKTPLSLIRLVGDTLARRRYTTTETVQDYARLLSEEASRLSRSIDNLLAYARYSGPPEEKAIEFTSNDVRDLVEEALERFGPTLEQLGFQLRVDVPDDLPHVSGDRAAIVQAMENVIHNAIKYSGQARVLNIVGRAEGRYVQVKFVDRGAGIGKEDIGHVFERFYRGRNTTRDGSGLGLAIAQRIVRHHGGDIAIRSAVGAGTEVELLLLAARAS